MLLRRLRPDGDVAAAAQRRLIALAQHHGTPSGLEDDDRSAAPALEDRRPAEDAPARHVAVRRSELGRWGLTGQQVTVAAICLIVLVVLGAWWALRSVPHTDQVTLSASRSTPSVTPKAADPGDAADRSPAPQVESAGGAGAASGRVVVDVAGRVRRPGIVELPTGSRVVDAIAAAGGVRPGVALTSLNLARLLVDGEQILVGVRVPGGAGVPPAPGAASTSSTAITPIELNAATVDQLDTLPGIGPVTAQAITQWRADNGPFTNVNELLQVSGIGEVTLADIRPYVYV